MKYDTAAITTVASTNRVLTAITELRMKRKSHSESDEGPPRKRSKKRKQATAKRISPVTPGVCSPRAAQGSLPEGEDSCHRRVTKTRASPGRKPTWQKARQCHPPAQSDQPGRSVQSSKRKRDASSLDAEDLNAAKKSRASVASTSCSWGTPLAKLWEICHKLLGRLQAPFFGKAGFSSLYNVGKMLGQGGFGSVYEGTRKQDGKNVALKFILKAHDDEYLTLPETSHTLPLEVALHLLVSQPPACDHVVGLLDWFDQPDQIVLVMEHPAPCTDVYDYMCNVADGALSEDTARGIMRQAVLACRHCRDRGVLHRDVKGENLLLQTDTLQVKLIDFGCGDLLKEEPYHEYSGTVDYCPPECFTKGMYNGREATVWSLGVLLFLMVNGKLPYRDVHRIRRGHRLRFKTGVSKECRHLIHSCLRRNAKARPTLEEILQNDWLLNRDLCPHS